MKHTRLFLIAGVLTLTACGSPLMATAPPSMPAPTQLGVVELEFEEGGTQPAQAQIVPVIRSQALTDAPYVTTGSVLTRNYADANGKRYLQATIPVTNHCTTDLKNLTFVATRRLGSTATLSGTAVTSITTFSGTPAAASLATQILPTQPLYVSGDKLLLDQRTADLQIFDDTDSGELDGLQAQIDARRSTYDLLPYGFVATTSSGSRVIPVGATGNVTVALSTPIQAQHAQDVFRFKLLFTEVTNSFTTTQGLEEQDQAGKAAVEARLAALPGGTVRTLLGPTLAPSNVARDSLVVCRVRTAGPRSAPTATLLNTPGTYRLVMTPPTYPLVIGGVHPQPSVTFAVNGVTFPTIGLYRSLTPATLSVTNNLVHPVATVPLARQTGTVQGQVCGQTATATLRTSPFTSLAAGETHSLALKPDGTVVGWGDDRKGQSTPPTGLQNVVAVAAGQDESLALKADGTVVAWGDNRSGYSSVPAGLSNVIAIATKNLQHLALKRDGTVVQWGFDATGQLAVPAGLSDVVGIALGARTSWRSKRTGRWLPGVPTTRVRRRCHQTSGT